jgi:hypothetical protein
MDVMEFRSLLRNLTHQIFKTSRTSSPAWFYHLTNPVSPENLLPHPSAFSSAAVTAQSGSPEPAPQQLSYT